MSQKILHVVYDPMARQNKATIAYIPVDVMLHIVRVLSTFFTVEAFLQHRYPPRTPRTQQRRWIAPVLSTFTPYQGANTVHPRFPPGTADSWLLIGPIPAQGGEKVDGAMGLYFFIESEWNKDIKDIGEIAETFIIEYKVKGTLKRISII